LASLAQERGGVEASQGEEVVVIETLIAVAGIIGVIIVVVFAFMLMVKAFYKKVEQGKALIVNTTKSEPTVTFTGALVLPVIHRAEEMDISLKTIEIDRRGKDGLICQDNIRADIKVTFFVRVNKTQEDVLKVAQAIGCKRASDPETLEQLFNAKFSEALKGVGKNMEFEQLYTQREKFRNDIVKAIGDDLNGYALEDAAIDFLEQTPVEILDKDNILDAQGIEKITRLTAIQSVTTNHHRNEERKKIKDQDVRANKEVYNMEREQAEALEVQKREITMAQAKNEAETRRFQAQQLQEAETARIQATQQVALLEEQKKREVEIADARRKGTLQVEAERIRKETELEAIRREREVELTRISKEKDLEKEQKEIAEVRRQRIAVEKGTVEEEERIKDTRAFKEADRSKQVRVTNAEAEAQEHLVKNIKAAEAEEEVAKHDARKRLTLAEAALEAADKEAKAKQRTAEGVQAEVAAPGLAQARVKEATATAIEKEGRAEATVMREKMLAEATGLEEKGMVEVRVKDARAAAIEKEGRAEATVVREKMLAEATGTQEQGLAQVRVHEAEADVIARRGAAEADAIQKKLVAEATGLAEKAAAMKALDGVGREHEEFRLKLQTMQTIQIEQIGAQRQIAEAQAHVLAEAFKSADINIVGGDGQFFERFIQAVTVGRSLDGFMDNSDTAKALFKDYLSGEANLPHDLKDILSRPALGSQDVQNLTVSALLAKLATGADEEQKKKLGALAAKARELGLDKILQG
jgi:uncharacterized membrane protein YqiK